MGLFSLWHVFKILPVDIVTEMCYNKIMNKKEEDL